MNEVIAIHKNVVETYEEDIWEINKDIQVFANILNSRLDCISIVLVEK